MIHTDGTPTVANRPVDTFKQALANAEAFKRTLETIKALPEVKR